MSWRAVLYLAGEATEEGLHEAVELAGRWSEGVVVEDGRALDRGHEVRDQVDED